MKKLSVQLVPSQDIEGNGPRWTALSDAPWFAVKTKGSLAGRWIKIVWRSGLLDPVCRPVLRCTTSSGVVDIIFAAAIFGANEWVGYIPEETETVSLSPVNYRGEFGFEIEQLCFVSTLDLCRVVFGRVPSLGFLALGAWFIGRKNDVFHIVRDAIATQPLHGYARWRAARLRQFDPKGIDGELSNAAKRVRVRFIVDLKDGDVQYIVPLIDDLAGQPAGIWSLGIIAPPARHGALRDLIGNQASIGIVVPPDDPAELVGDLSDTDLVSFIPPGARLEPTAVATMAMIAVHQPEVQFFYSDTDRIAGDGTRCDPTFRSGFDPVLFEQLDVTDASGFWRAGALKMAGSGSGMPFQIAPDWPSVPRLAPISRVLVSLPTSYSAPSRSRAMDLPEPVDAEATIIIPTRDRLDLLRPCVDGLLEKTQGRLRIIVVDNGSAEDATHAYFAEIVRDARVMIAPMAGPFNFSRLCNAAVEMTTSDILVFLNNDTSVIREDWLLQLKRYVLDPGIGAVGAKLLYPSGKVQHCGVVAGMGGQAGHFEQGADQSDPGYFGRSLLPHSVSAVTGACLAVERRKFLEVGGFDAVNLPIDLNDIDLCLRLAEKGYRTLYLPDSVLIHHESASRGHPNDTEKRYTHERAYFRRRWLHVSRADPYFSPVLSLYASNAMLG